MRDFLKTLLCVLTLTASACKFDASGLSAGDPCASNADCDDSDKCTFDYCGADDVCHNDAVDSDECAMEEPDAGMGTDANPGTDAGSDADPGIPGVTISSTTISATEGAATGSYTVVLDSRPLSDVSVSVTPNAQVSVSASTLTFTSGNWNVAQTVTVTAADDSVYEGAHTGAVTHATGSSDQSYVGVSVASVTVNVTDNDAAPVLPTITCSPAGSPASPTLQLTISGPGITASFYGTASYSPTTACYLQAGYSESTSAGSSWPPYALTNGSLSQQWVSDGDTYTLILPNGADGINVAANCGGTTTYFDVTQTGAAGADGVGSHFMVANTSGGTCQVLCGAGGCAISTDATYP